jgi:hypothetical protein
MNTYYVNFFKSLIGCNGRLVKAPQGSIEIHSARTRERAVQAAQRRFARLKHISDWSIYADKLEVITLPAEQVAAGGVTSPATKAVAKRHTPAQRRGAASTIQG